MFKRFIYCFFTCILLQASTSITLQANVVTVLSINLDYSYKYKYVLNTREGFIKIQSIEPLVFIKCGGCSYEVHHTESSSSSDNLINPVSFDFKSNHIITAVASF